MEFPWNPYGIVPWNPCGLVHGIQGGYAQIPYGICGIHVESIWN
jgi:hypothetical protein